MSEGQNRREKSEKNAPARVDKFAARQSELADAALETLAELGYARTSLREIADKTEFSHAVLRYYFADKLDLITHCIRQYKAVCVRRYDAATAEARTQDELVDTFLGKLADSLEKEAHLHRLWYDLRSQALFENALHDDVAKIDKDLEGMVWKVGKRYAELGGSSPKLSSPALYALFDGLFQSTLAKVISGNPNATSKLCGELRKIFPTIC